MILNPFEGYSIKERNITSLGIRETIKELAQLDGAFVITENGIIEAAGRYLEVDTKKVDIPRGLGARHAAVAAMTAASNALGITVSQSGGMVRIFKKGEMVMMIEPHRRISL
jgi:DNA integrity scanning protein DisA with diadenylate cyclase activity